MIERLLRRGGAAFLLALSLTACSGEQKPAATIRLATTTSARDTGLLDVLLPEFTKDTGIEVQAIAVGTGEALKYGERGDADVVLVHARKAEDAFLAGGFGVERRDVWWNRFLIVGPAKGSYGEFNYIGSMSTALPSGLHLPPKGSDAARFLMEIGVTGALFVSRGDDSGTHKREMELYGAEGPNIRRMETGQGMGPTLTVADEKDAYTLTDEGTYLKMRKRLRLVPVLADDPKLVNPYGAILVHSAAGPRFDSARKLLEWLTGTRCRSLVQHFRVDGQRAFFLPGESPTEALRGRLDPEPPVEDEGPR